MIGSSLKLTGAVSHLLTKQWPVTSLQIFSHMQRFSERHPFSRYMPVMAWGTSSLHTSAALDAARKGTRAKREAKKKAMKRKKEATKTEVVPVKKWMSKQTISEKSPRRKEDHLTDPVDDVYFSICYKWKLHTVKEAMTKHREAHHETLLDAPDSPVKAYVQLYMNLDKKNRYADAFYDVVKLPHLFNAEQEKSVLVISRNEEVLKYAQQMNVPLALGPEVIKMAQNGEVNLSEFKYVISERDFLPELVAIRGLMKKTFPNPKNGTAGADLIPIIDRFMLGVEYKVEKNKFHQDFASIEVPVGNLSMTDEQLEENVSVIVQSIEERRKNYRKSHNLVSLVMLHSPPGREKLKINHFAYIEDLSAKAKSTPENETDDFEDLLAQEVN